MKNLKVYISGPISAIPNDICNEHFSNAEGALIHQGYEVVNPMKIEGHKTIIADLANGVINSTQAWQAHMKLDIIELMKCDAIYMLNGWMESKGATFERDLATSLGILEILKQ